MPAVTPFGNLEFGSEEGLAQWLAAHAQAHRAYGRVLAQRGIALTRPPLSDKPVDNDWLGRHLFLHIGLDNIIIPDNTNSETGLANTNWHNEAQFYDWHNYHNAAHQRFEQAFGISGTTF